MYLEGESTQTMTISTDATLSPITGFIEPIEKITRKSHSSWEIIIDQLPELLANFTFRTVMEDMAILSVTELTINELKRAYVILTMFTNAYLWGYHTIDSVIHTIPSSISIPLLECCKILKMMPISTYATVCIWNVKKRVDNVYNLDTMECMNTYTRTQDESHFFLVSSAIDAYGHTTIPKIEKLIHSFSVMAIEDIQSTLLSINKDIQHMTSLLTRMGEKCDPSIFYNVVRHYQKGSLHAEGCLFEGYYEIDDHWKELCTLREGGLFFKLHGGSAAQSPIIHLIDSFLGIEHHPTGKIGVNFIPLMRSYMYYKHREYLNASELQSVSFRDFVIKNGLQVEFNELIASVKVFRDTHFQMVARYIINQSGRQAIGTGGTQLVKFLKQSRDETKQSMLDTYK